MENKEDLVDSRTVLDALGIKTKSTLSRHIKRGLPVAARKPHAGHHKNLFDLDAVRKWYAENVRADSAKLAHIGSKKESEEKSDPVPTKPTESPHTWSMALERCRTAERFVHNEWVKAVNQQDDARAASMYRTWEKAMDTLRRVEKDSALIEKQRGEVVSLKEAERIYMLAHGAVEGELRSFAKRLGPAVASKRSKAECVKVIDIEVDRVLRHIVGALRTLKEAG
jgi:hypothetical protein